MTEYKNRSLEVLTEAMEESKKVVLVAIMTLGCIELIARAKQVQVSKVKENVK